MPDLFVEAYDHLILFVKQLIAPIDLGFVVVLCIHFGAQNFLFTLAIDACNFVALFPVLFLGLIIGVFNVALRLQVKCFRRWVSTQEK